MKTWKTKNGVEIPYNELKLNHIHSIIKVAKEKGFYKDGKDISEDIIIDMKEELHRREIYTIYYIALIDKGSAHRVSIIFTALEDALRDIRSRLSRDYILIKSEIL